MTSVALELGGGKKERAKQQTKKEESISVETSFALSFEDLTYEIDTPEGKKKILNGITGLVNPGEMCAILGPSGSGKTTLLDMLLGRIEGGEQSGTICVNGKESNPGEVSRYVPQEDIFMGTMTVKETFEFSGNLSVHPNFQNPEKINELIKKLGLKACENVRIGTILLRGISGGQKRRVSLGIELLSDSGLLFLDEPTSGIDAYSTYKVCEILKNLALENYSILCTIHQPNSRVFQMFDKALFLSGGNQIYFGPISKIKDHFNSIGYAVPENHNPADHVLDLTNMDFEETTVEDILQFSKFYEESDLLKNVKSEIDLCKENALDVPFQLPYVAPFYVQIYELFIRSGKDNFRNPAVFWVRIGLFVGLALMLGTIYWDIGMDQNDIQDRTAVLFYYVNFMSFMAIAVIPAFLDERAVIVRERANGWYNVVNYVIAQTFTAIPPILFMSLLAAVIVFYFCGLNGSFGTFFFVFFLQLWCSESFMMFASCIVPHYIIGMAFGAGVFCLFMSTEGFFILPENIPVYWIWSYYLGFHTFCFEALMFNEYENLTFNCPPVNENGCSECQFPTGKDVLTYYEMDDSDLGMNILALVGYALMYRVLFCIVVWKFHTGKK